MEDAALASGILARLAALGHVFLQHVGHDKICAARPPEDCLNRLPEDLPYMGGDVRLPYMGGANLQGGGERMREEGRMRDA